MFLSGSSNVDITNDLYGCTTLWGTLLDQSLRYALANSSSKFRLGAILSEGLPQGFCVS